GILHDHSINWFVKAYHTINKPELINKSFSLCKVQNFNLSFTSLTSPEAL
ncbi:hypothetical protein PAXRUDRAFT_162783, partial [Paxillus rubicundulus Ve08.2h10]